MKLRKIILFTLALALILSLAACGEKNDTPDSTPSDSSVSEELSEDKEVETVKDTLTMPIDSDIGDINVHLYAGNMVAQGMVFEGLVNYKNGKIIPSLATDWDISDDGTVYTFHLRDDVKFTDGEKFNAEAVKANFEAVLKNASRHDWLVSCTKIKSCDVVDEYTFNLVLSEPYYPTLAELALVRPYRMMSPKSFIDGETHNGVSYLAGTGAYTLEDHVVDQYAVFKANEDYWGDVPAIKTVTLKVMPSGETTLLAFKNGELDFLFGTYYTSMIDVEALRLLEKDEKYQVKYSDPIASRYLLTNSHSDRPISDRNVKLAVWHSINREELCEYIFDGLETPAETLFPRTAPYCDIDLETRSLDLDKVNEYLEASGWTKEENAEYYTKDGKELTLELVYNGAIAGNKNISEYIQSNLKEAGINLELVAADSDSLYDLRGAGKYDLMLDASWGTPYDPQSTVTGIFSEGSFKICADGLDCYDELCDNVNNALVSVDEEERQGYFDNILNLIHNEAPFIPLSYTNSTITASADLKNVDFGYTQYDIPFQFYSY